MEPTAVRLDSSLVAAPKLSPGAKTFESAIVWTFCAAVLWLAFVRLRYGVDFVDEGTYIAVPYRFCLGDRPFVDDHSPNQTSAMIVWPLLRLYQAVHGSNEGSVYFARVLYFFFCCGVALVVASALRPWIGARTAALVGLAYVVLCPIGIPSLSYNTMSAGCFTAGLFLGLHVLLWQRGLRWLFAAGIAHGFAAMAIPSYVIPEACYAFALWTLLAAPNRRRGILLYAAGLATVCAAFLPWLVRFDAETLRNVYFHVRTEEGWWFRVKQFARQFSMFVPFGVGVALVVALSVLWLAIRRRMDRLAAIVLALLPLFPLVIKRSTTSMWYVTLLAACGTFLLVWTWRRPLSRTLAWGIWGPSSCAGAITSWTSDNGLVNAGHGLVPIALAGAALAVAVVRERTSAAGSEGIGGIGVIGVSGALGASPRPVWQHLEIVPPLLMVAVLLGYQRRAFGEDPVATLDTPVLSGPYRGLYTSREKETYLNAISDDLASIARDHERVLFVDHFPAGYLLTEMRPVAACIWTHACTGWSREDCDEEMRRNIERGERPGLAIVRMHSFPLRRDNEWTFEANELDKILESKFRRVLDRPGYTVFVGG
jgi:hypothetical protein